MNLYIVQHEECEAPGAFLSWADRRGYNTIFTRCYLKEKLIDDISNVDMLLVLGGPQSPDTTLQECPHFDSKAEMDLINKCIQSGKIVIGVCLGAQLMGKAAGAVHCHSPQKEVGTVELTLTEEGKKDPYLKDLPASFMAGSWHNDMPGVTQDSLVLAYSAGCPRQIIKYAPKAYGFQCHLEFTKEVVQLLLRDNGNDISDASIKPYVQTAEEILNFDYSQMNQYLETFLDNIVKDE